MSNDDATPGLESVKFTIRTRDFEKARWFYEDILMLPRVEEWDETTDRGIIFSVGRGGLIEISEIRPDNENHRPDFEEAMATDKVDMQLKTADVDAWAVRLAAADWPHNGPVDRPWGARYLYVRDPDGVKIIVYG